MLRAALAWWDAGCSVIPVKQNGDKRPEGTWDRYQRTRASREEVETWYRNGRTGIGAVCGQVSGNLEMTELEGRFVTEALGGYIGNLAGIMEPAGLGELWDRLWNGYVEQSPSGGVHILYRIAGSPVPGNTKLASRPARKEELSEKEVEVLASKPEKIFSRVLIETRGEGGYVVLAPSHGSVHPSGKPWIRLSGAPASIPTITLAERNEFHALLRTFDQMPHSVESAVIRDPFSGTSAEGTRPGDEFNRRATWEEVLEPHGWTVVFQQGEKTFWKHPAASHRWSATTNHNGQDYLYVFSTSSELDEQRAYDKFGAHARLNHSGDLGAAARALVQQGYGGRSDNSGTGHDDDDSEAGPEGTRELEVDVTNVADAANWLRKEMGLKGSRLSGFFYRAPNIVHTAQVGEKDYIPPVDDRDQDSPTQIRPVDAGNVRAEISYSYGCYKWVGKKDDLHTRNELFPMAAAQNAVDAPHLLPNLRHLRGVIHAPVVRKDGSVLASYGYDDETKLLYLPEVGLVVPPVSDHPTSQQIHRAVALLDKMTGEFQFVSEHDRANYYGLLLTPLLRQIAPPPYRLGAIGAPQPGSGKTLLATILRIVHGGVFRAEMPENDAELRKQITSILDVTTGPIVHFDNVTGVLRSSTLAGLLTSSQWDDRRLGVNEMISRNNDRLWVITGNNLVLGGDLPRRTVWVTIDPGVPNPELRTDFAIRDLEGWVRDHRGEIVAALLTLVRAWVSQGQPVRTQRGGDGYARWVETVDGIFATAGIEGEFAHEKSVRQQVGVDDDEWETFLRKVHEVFQGKSWTVKELLEEIDDERSLSFQDSRIELDDLPSELADKVVKSPRGVAGLGKSLGRWLMNREGRWAGQWTVRSAGMDRTRIKLWRVETVKIDKTPHEVAGFAGFAGFDSEPRAGEKNVSHSEKKKVKPVGLLGNPANPANPAMCQKCGEPLLLVRPGRTTCERCRLGS